MPLRWRVIMPRSCRSWTRHALHFGGFHLLTGIWFSPGNLGCTPQFESAERIEAQRFTFQGVSTEVPTPLNRLLVYSMAVTPDVFGIISSVIARGHVVLADGRHKQITG